MNSFVVVICLAEEISLDVSKGSKYEKKKQSRQSTSVSWATPPRAALRRRSPSLLSRPCRQMTRRRHVHLPRQPPLWRFRACCSRACRARCAGHRARSGAAAVNYPPQLCSQPSCTRRMRRRCRRHPCTRRLLASKPSTRVKTSRQTPSSARATALSRCPASESLSPPPPRLGAAASPRCLHGGWSLPSYARLALARNTVRRALARATARVMCLSERCNARWCIRQLKKARWCVLHSSSPQLLSRAMELDDKNAMCFSFFFFYFSFLSHIYI